MSYSNVFGGSSLLPSQSSYDLLSFGENQLLDWPTEANGGRPVVASIMDLQATQPGLSVSMPAATSGSLGQAVIFNNVGSYTVSVLNSLGGPILSLTPGTAWHIYLTDNTSADGTWRTVQFGASVSVASAAALAGSGLTAVSSTLNAAVSIVSFNSGYTAGVPDRAKGLIWTGGAGTLGFTGVSTLGANWFCYVRNAGSGNLTLDPASSELVNGATTLVLAPGDSCVVITDGSAFYTVGLGKSVSFAFDYTSINIAGTGNYTLSGSELNRISYKLTGALTGNRTITVPATVQLYFIDNATSGAFTLGIGTAAQVAGLTTVAVASGSRAILYCDGTNVIAAVTGSGISTPVTVANGGTGSTTASGARVNLGGTSVGIALFTAASAAAARTTLSVYSQDEVVALAIGLG